MQFPVYHAMLNLKSLPEIVLDDQIKQNPMDELLRARLRIPHGADRRLRAIRLAMTGVDGISRLLTGTGFFALREAEYLLRELDGRTGSDLVQVLLGQKQGTQITAQGLENIPTQGGVIIGSTHPVGTFDFIAHAAVLLDHRRDLKVVANREAERFLGVGRIIPVDINRDDKVLGARQTISEMDAHVKQGGALLVFGSGRVADQSKGLLVEPPWRTGITRVSEENNVIVVPASADMRNSRYYYRTRRIAHILSAGNEYFAREVASLRYSSELWAKLGGRYDVYYGAAEAAGIAPARLQMLAEQLVPGLYHQK